MSGDDRTYELKPMPAVPCIWQRHLWPHVPLGPLGTLPETEVRTLDDGSLEFDVTTNGQTLRYTSTDEGDSWSEGAAVVKPSPPSIRSLIEHLDDRFEVVALPEPERFTTPDGKHSVLLDEEARRRRRLEPVEVFGDTMKEAETTAKLQGMGLDEVLLVTPDTKRRGRR